MPVCLQGWRLHCSFDPARGGPSKWPKRSLDSNSPQGEHIVLDVELLQLNMLLAITTTVTTVVVSRDWSEGYTGIHFMYVLKILNIETHLVSYRNK